jgi:hypothetical protein
MKPLQRIRHIHIESGPLALDFQGSAEQIHCVATELAATADLEVTVDDDVRPDTPSLPCGELWELPLPDRETLPLSLGACRDFPAARYARPHEYRSSERGQFRDHSNDFHP